MDHSKEIERLKEELQELQAKYDFLIAAVDHLPNPIFIKDKSARFFFFNKSYANFFKMRRRDYVGKTVLDLDYLPLEDRQRFQQEDLKRIVDSDIISYDTVFTTDDGVAHPSFYWSRGFHEESTDSQGLVGEIVDITRERALQSSLDASLAELKNANEKLKVMAETDALTGLYNRSVLWDKGRDFIERSAREFKHSCMIMIDLDHFKSINDEFGHIKGDEILIGFAQILRDECRITDLPIRYGGDEFLLVLHDIRLDDAIKVAERIRACSEMKLLLPDGRNITTSAGVIEIDKDLDFEKNLTRLDDYLYEAKDRGRNRVVAI